jgi:hypothetical protein
MNVSSSPELLHDPWHDAGGLRQISASIAGLLLRVIVWLSFKSFKLPSSS